MNLSDLLNKHTKTAHERAIAWYFYSQGYNDAMINMYPRRRRQTVILRPSKEQFA
jgi:hypothetical protein